MTELGIPGRMPSPADLDAAAGACAFLANIFLREDAGAAAVANLSAASDFSAGAIAGWPLVDRNASTDRGLDELRASVVDAAPSDVLEVDYRRLFVGPGPMLAPPWESVHRSDEGLTFQDATLQVRQAYAEFGLAAPAVNREPDDHIGLELAFIGELCVAALRASEGGDVGGQAALVDAVMRFVHEHLALWAPRLAELVVEDAQTAFYRASGHLLAGTVEELVRLFPAPGEGQLASGA